MRIPPLLFNDNAADDIDLITLARLIVNPSFKMGCGASIFETIPHHTSTDW